MPHSGHVKVSVYNIPGEKVVELADDYMNSGIHKLIWDSQKGNGIIVPSGTYLYQVQFNGIVKTGKMILCK